MAEKLFLDVFPKYQNRAYIWINSLKFYTVCFYWMKSWWLSKYIESIQQETWFYIIKTSLVLKETIVLLLYFINWPNSIAWLLYFLRYWTICLLLFFVSRLWRHKFWSCPFNYLSNQAAFSTWPKSQDKNLNILRTTRAFKMK